MNVQLPQVDPPWDIRRAGRAWTTEAHDRWSLRPKAELIDGKLVFDNEERLVLLALLLENVGVDAAVRMGSPDVWREALDALGEAPGRV